MNNYYINGITGIMNVICDGELQDEFVMTVCGFSFISRECQTDDWTNQMIDHPSIDRVVNKMFNIVTFSNVSLCSTNNPNPEIFSLQ